MSAQLSMFAPMISEDSARRTFLRASGDGRLLSGLLDGPTTARSGLVARLASRSRFLAGDRGATTHGTFGPTSIESFATGGPLCSWENRLRARLATAGSMEWRLTWRRKTTPAGRSISRLAASAPRTSETGCTGWPTVVANDDNKSPSAHRAMKLRMGGNRTEIASLQVMAKELAGWSTLRATDGEKGGPRMAFSAGGEPLPMQAAALAGWPTINTPGGGRSPKGGMSTTGQTESGTKRQVDTAHVAREALAGWGTPRVGTNGGQGGNRLDNKARIEDQAHEVAMLAGWPTLVAQDSNGHGYTSGGGLTVPGVASSLSDPTGRASTGESGALSPRLASWLMGVPIEVLECAPPPMKRAGGSRSSKGKSRRASAS